jgi:hypothetical protein
MKESRYATPLRIGLLHGEAQAANLERMTVED